MGKAAAKQIDQVDQVDQVKDDWDSDDDDTVELVKLDESTFFVGRSEATLHPDVVEGVSQLAERVESIESKLDRLLAQSEPPKAKTRARKKAKTTARSRRTTKRSSTAKSK